MILVKIHVVDIHLLKKALALAFRMKSVSSPEGVPNTSCILEI